MVHTLQKHIESLDFLDKWIKLVRKAEDEKSIFDLINILANFSENKTDYINEKSFEEVMISLINIIDFINSSNYTPINLLNFKHELENKVINFLDTITNKYNFNLYCIGMDNNNLISRIIMPNVNVHHHIKELKPELKFNIAVIGNETEVDITVLNRFDYVVQYNQLVDELSLYAEALYYKNYDYNYLTNALKKAKNPSVESIIVGHSYALYGIDVGILKDEVVNLSLSSQDLYYSYKIARDIIEANDNIKKCYIATGYWSLGFDLSRSIKGEGSRIDNVYYPIFKDSHHRVCEEYYQGVNLGEKVDCVINKIFDMKKLNTIFSEIIFNRSKDYFNNFKRENYNGSGLNQFYKIDLKEKIRLGKERADIHNRLFKYAQTTEENSCILEAFIQYLNLKGVTPILVNFPNTQYYRNYLDSGFKEKYYSLMETLQNKYALRFIDLNKVGQFKDVDFIDLDHVNYKGACKISQVLNKL